MTSQIDKYKTYHVMSISLQTPICPQYEIRMTQTSLYNDVDRDFVTVGLWCNKVIGYDVIGIWARDLQLRDRGEIETSYAETETKTKTKIDRDP